MIIKLNKGKTQVQIVDDNGKVYGTSVAYLQYLLTGTLKQPFILCSRLPFNVSPDRFKPSPLFIPEGMSEAAVEALIKSDKELDTGNDSFSHKGTKDREDRKRYQDIKI